MGVRVTEALEESVMKEVCVGCAFHCRARKAASRREGAAGRWGGGGWGPETPSWPLPPQTRSCSPPPTFTRVWGDNMGSVEDTIKDKSARRSMVR